jgi:hypothetical protein
VQRLFVATSFQSGGIRFVFHRSQNWEMLLPNSRLTQWPFSVWPSSLLLVAKRMLARKTMMMTGTTKNGEVMLIGLGSLLD